MNVLNLPRLLRLIKIDLVISKKTILVTTATLIVILALLPFHITATTTTYFFILYTGGFIITSYAFSAMHDRRKSIHYLTLPCSNLERFLSKWCVTTLVYALSLLVLYTIFSWISLGMNLWIFNHPLHIFSLANPDLWWGIGKYIILQSLVLLGAAYFKNNVLLKTALTLGCLFILVAITLMLTAWIFCPHCFAMGFTHSLVLSVHGTYFIFWIVLAPFCWLMTYLRIADSEIK